MFYWIIVFLYFCETIITSFINDYCNKGNKSGQRIFLVGNLSFKRIA